MSDSSISRRHFLRSAAVATTLAGTSLAQSGDSELNAQNKVQLPQIHGPLEEDEKAPGPFLASDQRVGFAVVGLGRLSIDQILPAFGQSKYAKPVALVSGDRAKARRIAAQYGIKEASLYDYAGFERLGGNPDVMAVYIVLPNGLHREYVVRSAKVGKHVLCEKPMATSSKEAAEMITACRNANVKLMIAYRQQYEPHNVALRKLVREGKLGSLRGFVSSNSQRQGDPRQWRLNRALAGGGCLPDVGLYCVNASRFLSGAEPIAVLATAYQPKEDPRFEQVEAGCSFSLTFPNGYVATCTTSYDVHKSQFLRLEGTDAWAELSPAYAYHGNKLRWSRLEGETEQEMTPQIEEKNQFALEMDHFCECILNNETPQTPGEEGLRDHRIMEAIYESARLGRSVPLATAR